MVRKIIQRQPPHSRFIYTPKKVKANLQTSFPFPVQLPFLLLRSLWIVFIWVASFHNQFFFSFSRDALKSEDLNHTLLSPLPCLSQLARLALVTDYLPYLREIARLDHLGESVRKHFKRNRRYLKYFEQLGYYNIPRRKFIDICNVFHVLKYDWYRLGQLNMYRLKWQLTSLESVSHPLRNYFLI